MGVGGQCDREAVGVGLAWMPLDGCHLSYHLCFVHWCLLQDAPQEQ